MSDELKRFSPMLLKLRSLSQWSPGSIVESSREKLKMVPSPLPNETLNELLMIERTLWENDAQLYHDTYIPEAVLIFPGVGRIDRETAVAAIRKENADGRAWAEVQFDDAVGRWLTTDLAVLVNYCAAARWKHESVASQALCSTVYVRRAEAWRVAFHQQTPK